MEFSAGAVHRVNSKIAVFNSNRRLAREWKKRARVNDDARAATPHTSEMRVADDHEACSRSKNANERNGLSRRFVPALHNSQRTGRRPALTQNREHARKRSGRQ